MTFTAADVEQAVANGDFEYYSKYWAEREPESGGYNKIDEDAWYEIGSGEGRVTLNGTEYQWKGIEDIGGAGQGEYAAVIFKVGDRLFRKEGYYASHYGTDWDGDFSEVEAYEKTVTDYRLV